MEETSESLRLCTDRSGDVRSSGREGCCGDPGAPYNGFVPATRSGETGKIGIPGDMGNLVGEGGSIGPGLSLSFANLTVLMRVKVK